LPRRLFVWREIKDLGDKQYLKMKKHTNLENDGLFFGQGRE
jgi:hypothetical protein